MHQYYFERMTVWKAARLLSNSIYIITRDFPSDEDFHLKSQMRRSASSVKSNIAEGQGRSTSKDQAHFTTMSYSSLIELLNHVITASDQNYIEYEVYKKLRIEIDHIGRQLYALKKSQLKKRI